MRTIGNYKALATMPGDHTTKLKALAEAINLDFSLPALGVELMGEQGGAIVGGVKVYGSPQHAATLAIPSLDTVKAFLAQKWAVPLDNPVLTAVGQRVTQFFHTNMPELDLAWMNLFHFVDLRGSQASQFEVVDTNGGIAWSQRAPGEAVAPRRAISEAETAVKYLTFADGIGLLDDWLRFNRFWQVETVVAEFRATAFDKKASTHYGLFTALSAGVDVAFATDDTTTFNTAAATVLRAVRTKGYAAGQNAGFWIVCAPEKLGRVLRMLEATQGSAIVANQAAKEPLGYRVEGVIATTHVAAADTGYYLVLPKRKIQRGEWLDLQIESQRDIYTRATDWVGTMQFNAIIGDSDQVRRVKYA